MTCSVVIYDVQGDSPLYITVTFAPPSKWGGGRLSFFKSPKTSHFRPGTREASHHYNYYNVMHASSRGIPSTKSGSTLASTLCTILSDK